MDNLKQFASSANGDGWFLGTDEITNEELVVHRGNPSSGGHETISAIKAFLGQRPIGPEHEALLMLLADRKDQSAGEGGEVHIKPSP